MQQEQQTQERRVIAVIHKSERHQIQVSLATFRGRTHGDLRLFVLKGGDWIPTRKGCTIDVKQFHELEEAVWKLRDAYNLHPPF